MKAAIIINPFAGKRQGPRIRRLTEKMAADLGVSLSVKTINGPGDGCELARAAVNEGAERVVCAGGDGTLNAVASGLIGTGVPLGVVPMGSGNGYSRSLNMPQKEREALQAAFTGEARPMYVGVLNERPLLRGSRDQLLRVESWQRDPKGLCHSPDLVDRLDCERTVA